MGLAGIRTCVRGYVETQQGSSFTRTPGLMSFVFFAGVALKSDPLSSKHWTLPAPCKGNRYAYTPFVPKYTKIELYEELYDCAFTALITNDGLQ